MNFKTSWWKKFSSANQTLFSPQLVDCFCEDFNISILISSFFLSRVFIGSDRLNERSLRINKIQIQSMIQLFMEKKFNRNKSFIYLFFFPFFSILSSIADDRWEMILHFWGMPISFALSIRSAISVIRRSLSWRAADSTCP